MRPEVCVGAVVRWGSEILLIRRANPPQVGRWSLPGGRVEPGETLVQAVCREVLEETGIQITVTEFIAVVERISHDHHFVIVDYLAEPLIDPTSAAPPEPQAATDALAARWVPVVELPDIDLTEGLLMFLNEHQLSVG